MIFNRHSELRGRHSLLAPSQSATWMHDDYTEEQLFNRFQSRYAQDIGTYLHELAEILIRENVKLRKTDKNIVLIHLIQKGIPRAAIDVDRLYSNFMNYVNDAIGFRLTPEQPLYYSDNCFGTADAISFRNKFLRVHDYKSGKTPAKMEQLLCYAALFCLEYDVQPTSLEGCELRIYQNDEVIFHNPTPDEIIHAMEIVVDSDKYVNEVIIGG